MAIIHIKDNFGNRDQCRALPDLESQSNFIRQEFADRNILVIENACNNLSEVSQASILTDKTFLEYGIVNLLLGATVFYHLLCVGQIK